MDENYTVPVGGSEKVTPPEEMVVPFGKHAGKTLAQIAVEDVLYIDWLVDWEGLREPLKSAVEKVHEMYESIIDDEIASREIRMGWDGHK